MIQYDKDFVTLYYIDANGKKVSAYFADIVAYPKMDEIMGAQQQAMRENAKAVDDYRNALAKTQASVDIGRADQAPPAPVKPLQKVVADTGEITYVPFVPPLPDLVIPKTVPSGPIAVPTMDKQGLMYNMILAMFRKMFPEA